MFHPYGLSTTTFNDHVFCLSYWFIHKFLVFRMSRY